MKNQHDLLLAFSYFKHGDWDAIYKAISEKEAVTSEQIEEAVANTKCKWVTLLDPEYPESFKKFFKPPFVLYYEGNISLLNEEKKIGVVGSRRASDYGRDMTKKVCKTLVDNGYVIVSGLARGIDTYALEVGIEKGRAIAFIGNGIDIYYPAENCKLQKDIASKGLLMSEYPLGIKPDAAHFPIRNRLISYASDSLLVAEAAKRSGTLITAGITVDSGKDIYCFPYPADKESACNMLIQQGAFLVESASDIMYLGQNSYESKK